ncbi:MAG: hypothetical protein KJ057_05680 [Phycisphaerae bacterium]|nr:MAG: hypothetical protein F9K17_12545 [Phycisphaerae bacterium]MBE7458036.1 hypothetical protein [Planctomycetia bacterium]MCK6464500.1 hypothetical protein [Phycisphaerae bacterium]MCL4717950.1 hypothetical protein [Phycisphaerae bacterium]NUQ10176.1 hypothetical protein [Phycisphaerae bacterium]
MFSILLALLWSSTTNLAHPFADDECEKRKVDPASESYCGGYDTPCSTYTNAGLCGPAVEIEAQVILTGCMSSEQNTKCISTPLNPCWTEYECK